MGTIKKQFIERFDYYITCMIMNTIFVKRSIREFRLGIENIT